MIERLLPPYVACASTREDDAPPGTLYPEEAALVARSVDRRRHEFAAVRACARQAMAALGLPPAPVLRGHRGVPLWPAGTVGSMTHCDGYRAAALAGASDGIELDFDDAEISFHVTSGHTTEGTFTAQLMCTAPGLPGSFDGRWLVDDGFAVTAVTVPNLRRPADGNPEEQSHE